MGNGTGCSLVHKMRRSRVERSATQLSSRKKWLSSQWLLPMQSWDICSLHSGFWSDIFSQKCIISEIWLIFRFTVEYAAISFHHCLLKIAKSVCGCVSFLIPFFFAVSRCSSIASVAKLLPLGWDGMIIRREIYTSIHSCMTSLLGQLLCVQNSPFSNFYP